MSNIESALSTKWFNMGSQALNNAENHIRKSTDIIHMRYSCPDDPTNDST